MKSLRKLSLVCVLLVLTAAAAWTQSFRVQDFGQVQANGATPGTVALGFSYTGLSAAPTFSLVYGTDFSLGSPACTVASVTTCSLPVSFLPHFPGLRQDALRVKNQSGTLLETVFLHGLGLAAQISLGPGVISTFAGSGAWGYVNSSSPTAAAFRNPAGLAVDASGNLYIADTINQAIRRVSAANGAVTTIAGIGNASGNSGDGGPATAAKLNNPTGVALDAAGNLYIADQGNNVIRKVTALTGIITTVAGGGSGGSGTDGFGDGGLATNAVLNGPGDVAVDANGNLYIADSFHHLIRVVNAATGIITVVAGGGASAGFDGGPATSAQLNNPSSVALDAAGNLYIADTGNCLIRRVDMTTGTISAVAGNWGYGYSGDGGSAVDASLASPAGVRVDAAGDIYIADFGNSVIRQVQAASGKIVTIAGSGATDYSGDGGDPTLAALKNPDAIALDSAGSLYISDYSNNVIRKVSFPAPLSFPDENVGALSAAQVITAFNIGNRNLTLNALSLTADFALQASGDIDCAAPSSVSPGASCSIAIGFSPTAAGSRAGTLQLTTNSLSAASSSQTVNLSGTGTGSLATAPKASLSTTTLNFGSQGTWTTSGAQTVTLSNPGGSDTNISSIWLAGSDSSDFHIIAMTCGSVLTAGANCAVSVTFSPTASGVRTATLSFADSVAGSPQIVTLNGAGVGGSVALSPSTLVFSQQLGVPSAAQIVTFSNIGAYPVSIGSILLSGANVSDFSLSTTCGSSLAAGAHCTASATFTPLAAGVRTASLVFTDDAAGSSQTVTLSGAGVDVPVSAGLRFIPVAPCRVADTRWDPGPFGGPMIGHDSSRDFVIPNSSCGIPATAKAYSLNVTVVPAGIIGYLEIWPTGQPQPVASLLNSDGRVKANAAIVPAGTNGAVSVYSSDPTQVILDINGYFVPASDPAGLAFYPLTPCRVADTRDGNFAPALSKDEIRIFKVATKCGVPASAAAYSMNVTVVPRGVIGFLSAFPAGQNLPNSSTLNSNGAVLANAAIVPAGANGSIAVYSSDPTDVVLDIDGYFAPPATGGLSLFNLTPCRVYDSRFAGPPPHTPVSGTLAIGVASSPCAVPLGAQAYVLNTTVVPASDLGALTLYPNGAPTPLASTLNADDLAVTSNMAIIPTTNGLVNAWASSSTHLILDVYGYFAP